MRLSSKHLTVLHAIQLSANTPVTLISEMTGLPTHSVHYYIKQLEEMGVIHRWPLLNVSALGYTKYEIFFSLAAQSDRSREKLLKALAISERVAWFAELGGSYHYTMTVCASDLSDLYSFLNSLSEAFGDAFFNKAVTVLYSYTIFRKDYLCKEAKKHEPRHATFTHTNAQVSLDDIDIRIISSLYEKNWRSNREQAQHLRLPRATLEYRLRKLQENEVIVGDLFWTSTDLFGVSAYKLLVYAKGLHGRFRDSLFSFCLDHPNIVNFTDVFGSWDFEIGVEVPMASDVVGIAQKLSYAFGPYISDIRMLPVFKQGYSKNFLQMLQPKQPHSRAAN